MKEWIGSRGSDFWTGLFLMILSGAVITESINLEIGTPTSPGSGFMTFGTAGVLGILALHTFVKSILLPKGKVEQDSETIHRGRIAVVVVVNIIYIVFLQRVGYLLCTFFLMSFLFQVYKRGKWIWSIGGAAFTSLFTYMAFTRLLQLNMPKGLIPFL
jgi:putative tricarboxylic transport membrane protein